MRARGFLHHCIRNAGLLVLKCQATDKPKALILRRGPHRGGGPWTLSRLIQLCYNPLPTRTSSAPRRPFSSVSLYLLTPSSPISGAPLSGVAEAERAFVSNPVYDRGHTANPLHRNLPFPRAKLLRSPLQHRAKYSNAIRAEFNVRGSKEIIINSLKKLA